MYGTLGFHFYIQNSIDSNSIIYFKKMHIKIKFSQKLPKELLIIVLLDITEPFLLMDKLDLVKHSQLQEKFNTVAFQSPTAVMHVGTILKGSFGRFPFLKLVTSLSLRATLIRVTILMLTSAAPSFCSNDLVT